MGDLKDENIDIMSNVSKILIPDLPKTKHIIKYLNKIDKNNTYSNFGPLNIELIENIEQFWGHRINVITTSSGTNSLIGAILAKAGFAKDNKKICIVPAYTFVGTISAILSAGYTPLLFDTSLDWDMDIEEIKKLHLFDNIGLVVPVSIYGKNVDIDKWENFTKETDIPVVIDSAACFDTLTLDYLDKIENCVLCISLHATKSFGIGEGGLIIMSNAIDKEKYIRAINFGFFNTRESYGYSINGKMSEYHAAVGLASLNLWDEKIKHYNDLKNLYQTISLKYKIDKHIICGPPSHIHIAFLSNQLD